MSGEELELALAARITQKRQEQKGIEQRRADIEKMTGTVARLDDEMAQIRGAIAAGVAWAPQDAASGRTAGATAPAATMQNNA